MPFSPSLFLPPASELVPPTFPPPSFVPLPGNALRIGPLHSNDNSHCILLADPSVLPPAPSAA
eukprot:8955624-Pyramimonas_sp.AAC.1